MRALVSLTLSSVAVLFLAGHYAGPGRSYAPFTGLVRLRAERVTLDPAAPHRRRLGRLTYLGGVALSGEGGAFGGYSALGVEGDVFTLLSDRGGLLRFRMGADWRPGPGEVWPLPDGPGTGWTKEDRDSESLVLDQAGRHVWVGFERANELWRYAADGAGRWRVDRRHAPAAMSEWPDNGGAESMARLPDGRFLVVSEGRRPTGAARGREALVFMGDPTERQTRVFRFTYVPAPGFEPADAAALPDGRLLVLERGFRFPNTWRSRLAVFSGARMRPGAVVAGREVARLERPLASDNFEGLVVVREGAATVLWLVSDDNEARWQRTLLLKFRLDG